MQSGSSWTTQTAHNSPTKTVLLAKPKQIPWVTNPILNKSPGVRTHQSSYRFYRFQSVVSSFPSLHIYLVGRSWWGRGEKRPDKIEVRRVNTRENRVRSGVIGKVLVVQA